ncbi:MAG: kinase [Lachnospiraceae bacterium]|nr:kinase [Lachnospiraceae bacterium]
MERLEKIQAFLREKNIDFDYTGENGCGSIDFQFRGVPYHIWEFPPEEPGCESNIRTGGRVEEFSGDYEEEILAVLRDWDAMK